MQSHNRSDNLSDSTDATPVSFQGRCDGPNLVFLPYRRLHSMQWLLSPRSKPLWSDSVPHPGWRQVAPDPPSSCRMNVAAMQHRAHPISGPFCKYYVRCATGTRQTITTLLFSSLSDCHSRMARVKPHTHTHKHAASCYAHPGY